MARATSEIPVCCCALLETASLQVMNPHAPHASRDRCSISDSFRRFADAPARLETPLRDPLPLARHHFWAKPSSLARGIAIISQQRLPTPPANRANDSIMTVTFPVPQDPGCDPG